MEGSKSHELGCGFVLELNPLIGADDDIMVRLSSVFQTLPQNVGVQVSILGSPNIDRFLRAYEEEQHARVGNSVLNAELFGELAKKRVEWWRKGTLDALYPGNPMRFREFRVNLSVTIPDINLNNPHEVERTLNMREGLIAGLKASGLYFGTWGPDDLLSWARDLANPVRMLYGKHRDLPDVWDSNQPIRDQIVLPSTVMRVINNGRELRFGSIDNGDAVSVRCLSVSQYPSGRAYHLANMGSLIGDPVQINLNYTCPFLITMNMVKGDFESDKAKVTMKAARASQNAASPMAKVLPEFHKKNEDWQLALNSFEDGSGGVVKIFHQVTLFDLPERITASENAAEAIWRTNGFSLATDQYLQMQSYLASFPMALDKDMIRDLEENKRFNTKTLMNSVSLAPLLGEWAGLGDPVIGLYGRNGQAMGIDLFANPSGNYNAAVVGTSGSGKSFLINEVVRNYLGSDSQVWVIDVGRSYQKFCEFIGGQYIEFNTESNIVINPFDMVVDFYEELNILKLMFSMMISPTEGLSDYQMSQLEKAISQVWEKKGRNAIIDDLRDELIHFVGLDGQPNIEINRLGEQIYPFTSQGVHGRWFNSVTTLEFEHDLVILEMEELKSKPDLQQVIMRFILYRITSAMYLSRQRRKVVVIDEAWDLLAGGSSAGKFIEEGYRRARKYKGSFLTGTQGISDYLRTPAALAALENSDWIFLLRGKEESITALEQKIALSPSMKSKIRSLNTEAGQYSDIFVYSPVGYGVGRLVSDPFNALLSSSKGEDFEAIRHKQREGLTISQAVETVLKERGIHVH
jgi:conjugal transfer ATP-binding protein TraC